MKYERPKMKRDARQKCSLFLILEQGASLVGRCGWVWVGVSVWVCWYCDLILYIMSYYTNLGYKKILGLRIDRQGQEKRLLEARG